MIVVALETATAATAVALADDRTVTEVVADGGRRHTESLATTLEALLADRGVAAREIGLVVVDVGPGLFTGLRVGVATAKGLAVATRAGLVAVTSTDVLAEAACASGVEGDVVCVVDTRRREVAAARYRCGGGVAVPMGAVELVAPSALAESLGGAGDAVTVLGDGAARYRDVLCGPRVALRDDLVVPPPSSAIHLARLRLAAGDAPLGHLDVHPWYLREADAVSNFAVREAT